MRILFLGNVNNRLLINLALELRKFDSVLTVDLLTEKPIAHNEAATAFDEIYAIPEGKIFRGMPAVKAVWMATQFRKTLKRIQKKYDVVHMFALHVGYTRSMNLLHEIAPKFFISVFGSELYESSDLILKELEPLVSMADRVTATNQVTLSAFCNRYNIESSKSTVCRFGLKPLEAITEQKTLGLSERKSAAGFPENSFVITCGWEASGLQQHELMIESIKEIKNQLPKNYLLVFPVAGGDAARIDLIRTRLKSSGLNYYFIEKYLPDEQLAHFRAASDIMIDVEKSFRFSGAVQEYIGAGNLVIVGDWLQGLELDEAGIQYWKVNHPTHVGEKVLELLSDLSHNRSRVKSNPDRILNSCNWNSNLKDWYKLYQA